MALSGFACSYYLHLHHLTLPLLLLVLTGYKQAKQASVEMHEDDPLSNRIRHIFRLLAQIEERILMYHDWSGGIVVCDLSIVVHLTFRC